VGVHAVERHRRILTLLEGMPVLTTDAVVTDLGVSAETVRRDLAHLEKQGRLTRVHGGATSVALTVTEESSYADRAVDRAEAKSAIGVAGAAMVSAGMTVVIDVGTTCLALARALPHDLRATVATPSLLVAAELSSRPSVTVLVPGGEIRAGDLACMGEDTVAFFTSLRPDLSFLGSGAVSAVSGLTDYHRREVATKRVVLGTSARTVALADSGKLDLTAPYVVCSLDQLDAVITERAPSEGFCEAASHVGLEICLASSSGVSP